MKKKSILLVIALVVVIIVLKVLTPTEKDFVKRDLKALKNAVENENTFETLKYIDQTYLDRNNLTFTEFTSIIDNFFEKFDTIRVVMSNMRVTIDSTSAQKTIFASCSLGLKVFARYEGDRVLVFGGIVKPAPVFARLRKSANHYKIYYAEY